MGEPKSVGEIRHIIRVAGKAKLMVRQILGWALFVAVPFGLKRSYAGQCDIVHKRIRFNMFIRIMSDMRIWDISLIILIIHALIFLQLFYQLWFWWKYPKTYKLHRDENRHMTLRAGSACECGPSLLSDFYQSATAHHKALFTLMES